MVRKKVWYTYEGRRVSSYEYTVLVAEKETRPLVEEFLKKTGWSVQNLAFKSGISLSSAYFFVNNSRPVALKTLQKLRDFVESYKDV